MMPRPLAFLALAVAAAPLSAVLSAALTAVWYELRWLPLIAGED